MMSKMGGCLGATEKFKPRERTVRSVVVSDWSQKLDNLFGVGVVQVVVLLARGVIIRMGVVRMDCCGSV